MQRLAGVAKAEAAAAKSGRSVGEQGKVGRGQLLRYGS